MKAKEKILNWLGRDAVAIPLFVLAAIIILTVVVPALLGAFAGMLCGAFAFVYGLLTGAGG